MSTMFVYLDSTKIDERPAVNYNWYNVTVTNITIKSINQSHSVTSVYIKFCSNPQTKSLGNLISFVSLVKIADIPNQNNTTANSTYSNSTNTTTGSNSTSPTDQNSTTNSTN
jgi:hypothetical protein